jgi:hypothetical protein
MADKAYRRAKILSLILSDTFTTFKSGHAEIEDKATNRSRKINSYKYTFKRSAQKGGYPCKTVRKS